MNKALESLVMIAPPPSLPIATGSSEGWRIFEAEFGTRLPQDFKDYIAIYGAGRWADFFGVINPFFDFKHPEAVEGWSSWMRGRLGHLATIAPNDAKYYAPFQPYPAPNGLLAFGYDDNGGTLCWQVTGEADSWRIVCLDGKTTEEFDSFDMTLTEFLDALMREKIVPNTFAPDFFPIQKPAFRPSNNQGI